MTQSNTGGKPVLPPRLAAGDHIRVVAPSRSRAILGDGNLDVTEDTLRALGLEVSFGAHVDERDRFDSSSVASRLADLHDAFSDPDVDGILTVIGGYNSHQLLPHLDMGLVRANPKVFCGYSDITALQHALLAGADLVTYSGLHWSTFGMRDHMEENLAWFRACLFDGKPFEVRPAPHWSDDAWYLDQDDRTYHHNTGWWTLQPGTASGRMLGGNASTLALLAGTPWLPDLTSAVLVLEDDFETDDVHFDRWLTSLLQQPGGDALAGVLIGRFQSASRIDQSTLEAIVVDRAELRGVPVLANVDIGHTNPMLTFPVGGDVEMAAVDDPAGSRIEITRH